MRLSQHLRPDLVLTGITGQNVTQVLGTLAGHLGRQLDGPPADEIERALLERETSHTTSLGHGVAIPHATIPDLPGQVILVARAAEPVQFGPPDTDPVWFFFVLLSPPDRENAHIKLLARICRLVRYPGFMEELREAKDTGEILDVIQRVDTEHV